MRLILASALVLALATPARADVGPKVGWAIVLGSAVAYEGWALKTHHQTLSQGVQHGPRWFKVGIAIGLGGLAIHLYVT